MPKQRRDENDSDPGLDPVLALLKDIRKSGQDVSQRLTTIETERFPGIAESISELDKKVFEVSLSTQHMGETVKKNEAGLTEITRTQMECRARVQHDTVNARLKKHDRLLEAPRVLKAAEDTGQVDVVAQRQMATDRSWADGGIGPVKMILWTAISAMGGAGLVGGLFVWIFMSAASK